MESEKKSLENNISLTIPIIIGYPAIDTFIYKNFVGEIISKEDSKGKESKYAKILDISLTKSSQPEFDVLITVKLETLTFLFRNKIVKALFNAKISFNPDDQVIYIESFELDTKGSNRFTDKILESIVNTFMYDQLKNRLRFDLKPKIDEQLTALNLKIENRFEAQNGLFIIGSMNQIIISRLEARDSGLWIFLVLEGWGMIEIDEINTEMPN